MREKKRILNPTIITIIYLVVASLWIIFSDIYLFDYLQSPELELLTFQTAKGLLFVGVTSLMLYYLMKREHKNFMDAQRRATRGQIHLQRLTEASPAGVLFINEKGVITYINKPALDIYEMRREDVLGKYYDDPDWQHKDVNGNMVPAEDHPYAKVMKYGKAVFDLKQIVEHEESDIPKKYLTVNAAPLHDDEGELEGVVCTLSDITSSVESARKLSEQEERYRQLVEESPYAIGIFQDGEIIFANPAAVDLLEAESSEDLIGKGIEDFVHPDFRERTQKRNEKLLAGDENVYPARDRYVTLKGNEKPVEVVATTFSYHGKPAIQVIAIDISERLDREFRLQKALDEKTLAMTEMHHRIKNNMAIVSGLMQIQSYDIKDPDVKDILMDNVRRIKSIATIHEQMYDNQDLNNIDVAENLERMTQAIIMDFPEMKITHDFEVDDISLNINQAVPFALFYNEVLSNVYKHAYVGADVSERICEVRCYQKGKDVTLQIKDNGVGIESEGDDAKGMGMKLLELTTDQLHGDLSVQNKTGTTITLTFRIEPFKKGSSMHQLT